MRWTTCVMIALAAMTLSACSAPEAKYPDQVRTAGSLLEEGNPSGALAQLQKVADLEHGTDADRLAYHLMYGKVLAALAQQAEPVFLGESVDPTVSAQWNAARDAATTQYAKARVEFLDASSLLPKARRAEGRSDQQHRNDEFEITLGIGLTYLREGILEDSPQRLAEAKRRFQACDQLASTAGLSPDQRARLTFYQARLTQPSGRLTRRLATQLLLSLQDFQNQQEQLGFSVHLAYRDMLDYIYRWDTPKAIQQISKSELEDAELRAEVAQRYLDWLREYHAGLSDLPPTWGRFQSKLDEFFASHRAWTEKKQSADRIIADAKSLVERLESDKTIDELVQIIGRLRDGVDPEFQDNAQYVEYYRTTIDNCVSALLSKAKGNMELGNYDEAEAAAQLAKKYSLEDILTTESRRTLQKRCDDQDLEIDSHQAFAELQAEVLDTLAKKGLPEAEKVLARKRDNEALTRGEYPQAVAALEQSIAQESEAYIEATRMIAEIETIESPAKRLETAQRLDRVVQDHQLNKNIAAQSTRIYRDALLDNRSFDEALSTTKRIEDFGPLGPSDFLATGLCYYEKNEFNKAADAFKNVEPAIIANSRLGVQLLRKSGESFLINGDAELGFQHLSTLRDTIHAAGQRDIDVETKLIDCCRLPLEDLELAESTDLETANKIRKWRTRWKGQEPRHLENLRELIRVNYTIGQQLLSDGDEGEAMAHFQESYEDLVAYLEREDALSSSDREMASRLFACFADYAPLEAGRTYVYEYEADQTRRTERRVKGQADDMLIEVEFGNNRSTERWWKTSNKIIREIERRNRPILVRIPNPETIDYEDVHGGQPMKVTEIGREFQHAGNRYQHCLVVRVYGSKQDRSKFYEYVLAPGVGIVKATSPSQDTYYLIESDAAPST